MGQKTGKQAEQTDVEAALLESEERFKSIFDNVTDGILVSEIETKRLCTANGAMCRMLGYSLEEIRGMTIADIHPEGVIPHVMAEIERQARGELSSVANTPFRRKDGSIFYTEVNPALIDFGGGKYLAGIFRDITERRRMEKEKRELEYKAQLSARLASVGEMASGIAHEINNPLTTIVGFSQLLMRRKDIPRGAIKDLKLINSEAQRVARVVEGLLTFARQRKPGRAQVDLNQIISQVLELRSYEMKVNGIEIETQLAQDLPKTMADAGQLQQVFLNIVINAEKEMAEAHGKGKLTVKTEKAGDTIRISFTDDGRGVSTENLPRIFDPFFTTREVGNGTGLGLSISHGIVAQHNGRIYAESQPGKGATFFVELPAR